MPNDLPSLLFGAPSAPEPSLCDTCQYAYNVAGGSASWGGRSYQQRYCGGPPTIAIHGGGRQECEHYTPRPAQST